MNKKIILFTLLITISACKTEKKKQKNDKFKNICYDGQDPTSWSEKKKLSEFSKGPCSPLFMVPGIGASDLIVQIDCQMLKKSDPNTFEKCGWNSCTKTSKSSKVPEKEYQVWVPAPLSPMSILTPLQENKDCFSGLIGTDYDTSTQKISYKPRPGVTIKPLGATSSTQTKSTGNCAFDGVQNLAPDIPNPEASAYFLGFKKRFEDMGYEIGLTLQAVPYDFRIADGMDSISKNLGNMLKEMFELVNKKVTILAHSMGNNRVSYALWGMEQADREKYIANYIAVAPPQIGASKALIFLTCGSEDLEFPFDTGLDFKTFTNSVETFASMLQMMPHEVFHTQRDTDWVKKILARVAYENGESEDPVFTFFPKREEICYPKFPSRNLCRSGLTDYKNFGSTKDGEQITAENFKEMMIKLSPNPNIEKLWPVRLDEYNTLPNFGVPLILVYGNSVKTVEKYHFKVDPKEYIEKHQNFCDEKNHGYEREYIFGDGTVPSPSPVTLGIKMAVDFDQGKTGAKPVTFVDVCSEQNQRKSPYQKIKENGEKIFEKNNYVGIPCDCREDLILTKHCTHNSMIWLPGLIDFVAESLNNGVRSSLSPEMEGKDEEYFEDWVENCRLFIGNYGGGKVRLVSN